MHKKIKSVICALISCALVGTATFSLSSCDFLEDSDQSSKVLSPSVSEVYDAWLEQGGEGDFNAFLKEYLSLRVGSVDAPTAKEFYETWLDEGNSGSYAAFLKEYLPTCSVGENDTDVAMHNLLSTVEVCCGFTVTKTETGSKKSATSVAWSSGSGVVWTLDKENGNAYIVTNYHVVYNADSNEKISNDIYLYLYGSMRDFMPEPNTATFSGGTDGIKATYVGGAMNYDIAVLEVQGSDLIKNSLMEEVSVGDSDSLLPYQKVHAVGNAEGEGLSVSEGVVSVVSEYIDMTAADEKTAVDFRVMRTDTPINHGNSGGGLYDAFGFLVGITNAKSVEEDVENMGYALPITQVKYVVENILDNGGTLKRAMLGITVQTVSSDAVIKDGNLDILEKVQVAEVSIGGIAFGKLCVGDVLTAVEIGGAKKTIEKKYQLIDYMFKVRKNTVVKLYITRSGVAQTVSFTFDRDKYFTSVV